MRSKKGHYKKSIIEFINISPKAKNDGDEKLFLFYDLQNNETVLEGS